MLMLICMIKSFSSSTNIYLNTSNVNVNQVIDKSTGEEVYLFKYI